MQVKNSLFIFLTVIALFFIFSKNIKALDTNYSIVDNNLNILMVGDIMTDRHIRKVINSYKDKSKSEKENLDNFVMKYLNNLSDVNSKYDYVVANLEGPITDNKSKTLNVDGSYNPELTFTLPTSTPYILNALNVKVVSLANNHMDNFYHAGYVSTQKYLDKSNIKYFGNPYNISLTSSSSPIERRTTQDSLSTTVCKNDICVAYIGYHQFTKNNDIKIISNEVKRLRSSSTPDFIIVMPHWGVEYQATATPFQKLAAHAWIDAGADMVVGAHPHVIENSEVYKGKDIYYSLGNYIFDQWKSEAVKTGLAINIQITKKNISNNLNYSTSSASTIRIERSIKVNNKGNQKVLINKVGIKYLEK